MFQIKSLLNDSQISMKKKNKLSYKSEEMNSLSFELNYMLVNVYFVHIKALELEMKPS